MKKKYRIEDLVIGTRIAIRVSDFGDYECGIFRGIKRLAFYPNDEAYIIKLQSVEDEEISEKIVTDKDLLMIG